MFIFERVVGVSTYMFFLLLFFYLIYISKKRNASKYLKIYVFVLFILAFIYIPSDSADLSRYVKSAKIYNIMDSSDLIDLIIESKAPMQIIYFYILGIPKVYGLIPAVSALIFYGSSFSIFSGIYEKYKISNKSLALSFLFFMLCCDFVSIISIIRCPVAFSIIAYCVYKELFEGKSLIANLPLYLFSALMHPAAMVLVLLRFVLIFIQREKKFFKKIVNYTIILLIFMMFLKYGHEFIQLILDKSDSYISREGYSYIWEYLISLLYFVFSSFIYLKTRNQFKDIEFKNLSKIFLASNILLLLFCREYSIFTRFQVFSSIIFMPIFCLYLDNSNSKRKITSLVFLLTVILIFFISCTRGNFCGFKYFVLD